MAHVVGGGPGCYFAVPSLFIGMGADGRWEQLT